MKRQLLVIISLLWGAAAYAETVTNESTPLPELVSSEAPPVVEEDAQNILRDLCNTYAKEDNIPAVEKEAYITKCLAGMTDLTEHVDEPLPMTVEDDQPTAATPTSTNANTPETSEGLVKDEIVTQPDPQAEQLDIK